MHASPHCVSHVSVSIKQSIFSCSTFSRTNRLFGFKERTLNNVNLREEVLFSRVGEENFTLRIFEKLLLVLCKLGNLELVSTAVLGTGERLILPNSTRVGWDDGTVELHGIVKIAVR